MACSRPSTIVLWSHVLAGKPGPWLRCGDMYCTLRGMSSHKKTRGKRHWNQHNWCSMRTTDSQHRSNRRILIHRDISEAVIRDKEKEETVTHMTEWQSVVTTPQMGAWRRSVLWRRRHGWSSSTQTRAMNNMRRGLFPATMLQPACQAGCSH